MQKNLCPHLFRDTFKVSHRIALKHIVLLRYVYLFLVIFHDKNCSVKQADFSFCTRLSAAAVRVNHCPLAVSAHSSGPNSSGESKPQPSCQNPYTNSKRGLSCVLANRKPLLTTSRFQTKLELINIYIFPMSQPEVRSRNGCVV